MAEGQPKPIGEIVLLLDSSKDSEEAFRLLNMSGLPFETQTSYEDWIPAIRFGGDTFKFLSGVHFLMKGLAPEAFRRYVNG